MSADTPGIYVLAAHPNWRTSRVNRQLLSAAQGVQRAQVQDLYGAYPDYAIDVPAEQAALLAAELIVLVHPIQWYAMPALQKLWFDEVLAHGWAYGEGGVALRGKALWLVATTGGPAESYQASGYNRYAFDAFLPPYEQSAAVCGMKFLPPLVLHGAHQASAEVVAAHVATFAERLRTWPNWPANQAAEDCPTCQVPTQDRSAA
jgi:glutathione-regulated potassium-efflux system ancillary protein KefF